MYGLGGSKDDLDGTPADQTIEYGWKGATYEIDLTDAHADEFQALMDGYIAASRKTSARVGRPRSSGLAPTQTTGKRVRGSGLSVVRTEVGPDPAGVRAWVDSNGITVAPKGRIARDVLVKFQEAESLYMNLENRDRHVRLTAV